MKSDPSRALYLPRVFEISERLSQNLQQRWLWADCVEKLIFFGPLILVTTLISFGF